MNYDFIVISNGYPSENRLYNNAFIHTRVKNYMSKGYRGVVLTIRPENKMLKEYTFGGVKVFEGNSTNTTDILKENINAKIFVHFVDKHMLKAITSVSNDFNIYIWIHGTEALSWKRRMFNLRLNFKSMLSFLKYVYFNKRQMKFMKKMINNSELNVKYIFVSNWMKQILEKDTHTKIKENEYEIIPNVIDEKIFSYEEKNVSKRLQVFSIRPYSSKKYANDITVKVILKLSKKQYFYDFTFNLYGDGILHNKYMKKIRKFKNVNIYKKFLSQEEISMIHKRCGVLISPTRQDAQGVSMCEAISSGLVPIVSNNTAIPEFVNSEFGFLCNSVNDFVNAFDIIYYNPNQYKIMSKKGAIFMHNKSGSSQINRELTLIGYDDMKVGLSK